MRGKTNPKVVVLGGGFGGLESAFYLRHKLGKKADITMVSDRDYFLYKPNTIYIPFGMDPEKLKIPLVRPTKKKNIDFVQAKAMEIDPEQKQVKLSEGTVDYDYLVVATGASMRAAEIPGLEQFARTIWTPEEMLKLRESLNQLRDNAKAGKQQELLFLVPPANKCSGPLYELVFMTDSWLREAGIRDKVKVTYSTFERGFIQAFGPRLNEHVEGEFEKRGITGLKEHTVKEVQKNRVDYTNGASVAYDVLVSFPPYIAAQPFPGLPADERGFLATNLASRQLQGHPDIYVAGDAGDFPVKQAFLAFLQADAVAEHIGSQILGKPFEEAFEPVSMCVMEQFNTATFAKVPLRLTGRPELPVEVPPEAFDGYKLGSSPVWRVGKKMLGMYLPWRFRNGNPFHAGLPWTGMEAGLKVMSGLLAK